MWKFIARRALLAVFIIVFGSLICYAVIRMLPSSYVERVARQRSTMPGSPGYQVILAQLTERYGMDRSILSGFGVWGANALRGQWGNSWFFDVPVTRKFADVIGYSIALNIITLFLEMGLCVPMGIAAARKQYGRTDYAVTVIALACVSLPVFFLATLLKYVFSIKLGWLDLYGVVGRYYQQLDAFGKLKDMAVHMIMPVATLTLANLGGLTRFTRTNMLEVLNADYIRTARAKGLPERVVISRHAFRNTLIPLITYMSYLLPGLFSGSMITETLFQIPGIGYISYQAMTGGDIPFAMFYATFLTVLTQVSLMTADILYAAVDPRVRVQ
ncbi:MAG: ABC transporter permease [Oscillospiraceae bacterium]|jgi:peptide/nickel transport system permease protein|nr:ABC transporter permease [Oscillospiraceae bacterium]